jgi:RimJ/RimL family protein N-acetyltransferase
MQGTHVCLSPFDQRHMDATRGWANDPILMRLLDRAWLVSETEHEAWFKNLGAHRDRAYFAVETCDTREHIGNVWLWDIDWRHRRAEIRVVLGPQSMHGRGFGTEGIDLLSRFAFERLNLHKLVAYVLSINPRARRAFEKASFELEGVLKADRWVEDAYVDVHVMGRCR